MATYLQGVTDYIPQFQPFQPDLNLYANVLQTKQTRYDSNYQALNNVYGQYYYADLTRDSNIERKDELIKNIDFNLKRVSGLDLSLEQNVGQAMQVFKPFYEDKNLMKDMAWTKNYNNQKGRAEGLKNSKDEETRGQFWDTGIREMDYRREEFKEAGAEAALSFADVSYTPYVNVMKKAQELAKDSGLSIETVDFSQDGKWIVKTKNGQQLMEPLSKLFEASLGSDPAVQAIYKTQAYVNRKDYAYSNAAQFNGDKNAAEMKYLEESYTLLKKQNDQRYNQLRSNSTVYDKKIADIEEQIKSGKAAPGAEEYLEQLKEGRDINNSVLQRIEKDNEALADRQNTAVTSTGFQNPYGDIESLRWKVDNGMSSLLMEKDLDEAAEVFAYRDAKQDLDANPYAVNEQKFQFDKYLTNLRGSYQLQAARERNAGERKNMIDKYKLETGAYGVNPETGDVELLAGYDDVFTEAGVEGGATDQLNLKEVARENAKMKTAEYATPYLRSMVSQLALYKRDGKINDEQIAQILGYKGKKGMTLEKFSEELGNNADENYKFVRGKLGMNELTKLSSRFDGWVAQNSHLKEVSANMDDFNIMSAQIGDYMSEWKEERKWRIETSKTVMHELESQGFKGAKYLYDENGMLRSEKDFEKISNQKLNKGSKGIFEETGTLGKIAKYASYMTLNPAMIAATHGLDYITSSSSDYQDMVNAAAKAYSTSTLIKDAPPGISQMGNMKGNGLFVPAVQSTLVNHKALGSKGRAYFYEFAKDVNGMDFGDTNKNQITFKGATKNAMDASIEDASYNQIGERLLKDLFMTTNNFKSKVQPFKLSSQLIAANNAKKSAMTVTPDAEWLKQYLSTGEDQDNNLLTKEQYNDILKNGITVIGDAGSFKNGLMKSAYMDPLQSYVEAGNTYTWNDPSGYGSWSVEKNNFGTSQYISTLNYKLYDPATGTMKDYRTSELGDYGNMLTTQRNNMMLHFKDVKSYNINAKNGR